MLGVAQWAFSREKMIFHVKIRKIVVLTLLCVYLNLAYLTYILLLLITYTICKNFKVYNMCF